MAFGVRLVHLVQVARSPVFEVPVAESRAYLQAATGAHDQHRVLAAPLYVRILSLQKEFPGGPAVATRLAQSLLGAVSSILVWGIARRVAGPRVGLGCGFAAAMYGPLIYFDGELRPATITVLFHLGVLAGLLRAEAGKNPYLWTASAGVIAFLAMLCGPQSLIVWLLVLPWVWRQAAGKAKAAAFVAGIGLAFLLAAGAEIQISWAAAPTLDALGPRLGRLWQGREWLPQVDLYQACRYSRVLAGLLWEHAIAFPFGLVGPVGLAGMGLCLTRQRQQSENLLLLAAVGSVTGILLLTEASAQARLPLAVLALVFCGVSVAEITTRRRRFLNRRLSAAGVFVSVCIIVSHLGWRGTDSAGAWHRYWMGYAYERLDMTATAISEYETAVANKVPIAGAYMALAGLHGQSGRHRRAVATYRDLLKRWPNYRPAIEALADAYMMNGQPRRAKAEYERLLETAPFHVSLGRLGDACRVVDDLPGAVHAYTRLLEQRPDSSRVRHQLARLHAVRGEMFQAETLYRQLITELEPNPGAVVELAQVLASQEKWDEAEQLLRRVVAITPQAQAAWWQLGIQLFRLERYNDALDPFLRLQRLAPDDHRVAGMLSKLYGRLGRDLEAQSAFQRYQNGKAQTEIRQRLEVEKNVLLGEILGDDL